jgi:hypothetical protein
MIFFFMITEPKNSKLHIIVLVSVIFLSVLTYAQDLYKLTVIVKHADGSAVPGANVCPDRYGCLNTDDSGIAVFTVEPGTYKIGAEKIYNIEGTRITYFNFTEVTVSSDTVVTLYVRPIPQCFYLRSFMLDKARVSPGESISGTAEWVFAKCCPNCIVYAVVYQGGNIVARLWEGGDAGRTHTVIRRSFTLRAPTTPGTYCITLNVAYAYSPPGPNEGVVARTCFNVKT